MNSLLPFNATTTEKQIESVIMRSSDLFVDIASLWNPLRCPVDRLPWLAWALSVDTWNSEWPESIKRAVIASSVQIHRTKGTVAAIERVMETLGIVVNLQEWFEFNGRPHTFRLTALVNNNLPLDTQDNAVILSERLYQTIQRLINQVKPVRSHYDFRVGVNFGGQIDLATGGLVLSTTRAILVSETSIRLDATPLRAITTINPLSIIRIKMEDA